MATFKWESGKTYTFAAKGFRYNNSFAFLVIEVEGKNESVILGTKSEFPISEMMALKGNSIELTYKGTKNVNGVDYTQLRLECIAW